MISRAVKAATDMLSSELNKHFNKQFGEIDKKYNTLTAENDNLKSKVDTMRAKIDSLLIKIAEQDSTIAAQEKLTKDALRWSNKIEQYSRRENLKIHGLKVEEHEECCEVVARMITKDLGIHLKDGDIAIAHPIPTRVQKTSADGVPFPPPIIVKFSTAARNRRDEVIKRRRQLKGSGQVVYEDLTELNVDLVYF